MTPELARLTVPELTLKPLPICTTPFDVVVAFGELAQEKASEIEDQERNSPLAHDDAGHGERSKLLTSTLTDKFLAGLTETSSPVGI